MIVFQHHIPIVKINRLKDEKVYQNDGIDQSINNESMINN